MFARAHPYTHATKTREQAREMRQESLNTGSKRRNELPTNRLSHLPLPIGLRRSGPFHPLLPPRLGKRPRSSRPEGLSRISTSLLFLFSRVLSSLSTCVPLSPSRRVFFVPPPPSRTSPLEVVAPSGSPNLPTDPHDSAPGIMVPAPKIEHARHEARSNLFLSLWYSWIAGALCWPFLPLLSWSSWSFPPQPLPLFLFLRTPSTDRNLLARGEPGIHRSR